MAAILLLLGLILIATAYEGTTSQLTTQLGQDAGTKLGGVSFAAWAAAIVAIGALGYAPVLRQPSRWLLALVFLVVVLETKGGIFTKLASELSAIPAAPAAPAAVPSNLPAIPVQTTSTSSSSSASPGGSGSPLGGADDLLSSGAGDDTLSGIGDDAISLGGSGSSAASVGALSSVGSGVSLDDAALLAA